MAGEAAEAEDDASMGGVDALQAADGGGDEATAPDPPDPEDPTVALRDRAEGQRGPGLRPRDGADPTVVTAWVLVLVGYTPVRFVEALFGVGYFGPLAWPAIVAMVGVLFGVIALLRSLDLGDRRLRAFAIGALALGMVRLFVMPWF